MKNPFKFGTIVTEPHFTNRIREIEIVKSTLNSDNHLTIISPRRYGKTSLLTKVTSQLDRPVIMIDMMLVNSVSQLANHTLKLIYKVYPFQKIKSQIRNFKIIPNLSINPMTSEVDVQFNPKSRNNNTELEDVFNLIEKLGSSQKTKPVVIFDEFQDVNRVDPQLFHLLRAIFQIHKHVNYVFMGSQEAMIEEIFLKKKSPFYHFGRTLQLGKIPNDEFLNYLIKGLGPVSKEAGKLAVRILDITDSHPYYTQQLAFFMWEICSRESDTSDPIREAIEDIIHNQDNNYERLWSTFNNTDRKILLNLAQYDLQPLSSEFLFRTELLPVSTASSSLKRLSKDGFLIKSKSNYTFEDPFFKLWINWRQGSLNNY